MKGIITDCRDGLKHEINIDYNIVTVDNRKIFQLINGVTGYESFYIDSKYIDLNKICKVGWCACVGTKNKYDKLFISGDEMYKALKPYMED